MGVRGVDEDMPGRNRRRPGNGPANRPEIVLVDLRDIQRQDSDPGVARAEPEGPGVEPIDHAVIRLVVEPMDRAGFGRDIHRRRISREFRRRDRRPNANKCAQRDGGESGETRTAGRQARDHGLERDTIRGRKTDVPRG